MTNKEFDDRVRDFMVNYNNIIKDTLRIPHEFELKLINSGKYSTLGFIKTLGDMDSLYTGTLEDIYKFLLIVVKVNYFQQHNS